MQRFERAALLACLAGLTLDPANAGRHFRLHVLIELAASLASPVGTSAPRPNQLRRLITRGAAVELLAPFEDPPEYPLTEPVFFEGRGYTLFTGQQEEGAFRLSRLLDVFDRPDPASPFVADEPQRLIKAALVLCGAIASRAGIAQYTPAGSADDVIVDDKALDNLGSCVRWTTADLDGLVATAGLEPSALDPLTVSVGDPSLGNFPLLNELQRRPIVRLESNDVVVPPGLFASALTHALLSWASREGHLDELATALTDATTVSIAEPLVRALGLRPLTPTTASPPLPPTVREVVCEMDHDAALLVMVVGDPLDGFDPNQYGQGGQLPDPVSKQIDDRLVALEAWLRDPTQGYEHVLLVLIGAAPAGRWFGFGTQHKLQLGTEFLGLTASTLEIMCFNEAGDPLALWRYAKALSALHGQLEIQSHHPLDEYAIYANHGHSFYTSDDRAPDFMWVTPGMGLDQRQRFLERTRRQSALFPTGDHIEVWARYEESAPIFFPRRSRGQACLVVHIEGTDVWIVGAPDSTVSPYVRSIYLDLVTAAAYWLWQAGPHVLEAVGSRGVTGALPTPSTFFMRLREPDEWASAPLTASAPSPGDIEYSVEVADQKVFIDLAPALRGSLSGPLNYGERQLCARLIAALLELWGTQDDDGAIAGPILERVAPVGQRKMILMLESSEAHRIGPDEGLPEWPKVSDWEDDQILEELATELARRGDKPSPSGDKAEQNRLAQGAVAFFHQQLAAAVAELTPVGLLEELLRLNEALLREHALRRLQVPTRIACFGEHSDIVKMIRAETHEMTRASLGQRFLLEYVAAQPPTGTRRLTRRRYAYLQALAAMVIDYGFLSDVIQFDLADTSVQVLPSGRLGTSEGVLGDARAAFMDRAIPEQVRAAQESFASHWRKFDGGESKPPAHWEDAFQAEFGYPFADLGNVLGELANHAFGAAGQVTSQRLDDLRADLVSKLGWDRARVDRVLVNLTIAPRADFLAPPGHRQEEVYPWRYNRAYSFLRRPLLLRQSGSDTEVVWGARGALMAGEYILDLLFSGRLEATSDEMKVLKSEISDEAGKEFAAHVADRVRGLDFEVRPGVKKIGRLRIRQDGNDLGDVDVLGADDQVKIIWAIECKNLGVARTPWELWSEVRDFEDPDKGIVAKHGRRADWLRAHLDEIVEWLNLPKGNWRIEPLIIVRSAMISLHLRPFAIPVIDAAALEDRLTTTVKHRAPRAELANSGGINLAIRSKPRQKPKAGKEAKKRR